MEFIKIESQDALEEAIRSLGGPERLVVCGKSDEAERLIEALEFNNDSSEQMIQGSLEINALEWFSERKNELQEDWDMDLSENEGEWLGEPDVKQGFFLATDILSSKPLSDLFALKINVKESWMIPAALKYGGWNDCPSPEIHCAVWKFWQEKYGAEIIGVSGDVIEAYVRNPPKTKEDAMELARQQYLYCTDIVHQGVETISNLAAAILNHNLWFFWWD